MFTFRYIKVHGERFSNRADTRGNRPPSIDSPPQNGRSRRHAMRLSWREIYRNVTWHRIRLRLLTRSEAIQPASLGYYPRVTSLGCSSLSKWRRFLPPDRRTNRLSRRPEILPRLHSGIMRREPRARRIPSQSLTAMMIASPKGSKCNYRRPSRTLFVK